MGIQVDNLILAGEAVVDEWETAAGKLQPKAGTAPNGVSISTAVATYTSTGDDVTGDFTNAGANISYVGNDWENDIVTSEDLAFGKTTTDIRVDPTKPSSNAVDGNVLTIVRPPTGDLDNIEFSIDIGASRAINSFTIVQGVNPGGAWELYYPKLVTISGSDDDISYDIITEDYDISSHNTPSTSANFNFSNLTEYKYYKFLFVNTTGGANTCQISDLELYAVGLSIADNTVDTIVAVSGNPTIAPASITVKNNLGQTLADNEVNVSYNLDTAGFTALESLDVFKARPDFTSVISLDLRLQPVDDAVFDLVSIAEPSSEALMLKEGEMEVQVNSQVVGKMSSTGYTFPDGTVQASAVDVLRIDLIENLIAINTLRDSVDAGWTVLDMIDGIADEYEDETGIDNGSSTNPTYDSPGNFYQKPTSANVKLLIQSETTNGSTTFVDSTGVHTSNITVNGDTQHSTAQAQWGSSSIRFDGTGDDLTIADSDDWNFGAGEFVISAWVRMDNISGLDTFIAQWAGSPNNSWDLEANGANLQFRYRTAGGSQVTVVSTTSPLSATTWHHVAAVRAVDTLTLYVDGNSVQTADFTGVTLNDAAGSGYQQGQRF